MDPRRPENGPAQDSTGVCTGTQPLCRPQTLGSRTISTICLPRGPDTECEAPGPGGPGSGPGTDPARADHPVVGESASEPLAAKGEAATVLLAAVGEATAGVAVEAAGAAIPGPAAVEETRADHGAGQRGESRPGGEDGRAAGRSDHGSGQGDPGRSRSGAERASKPGGEDGAAVEVTAEVRASKPNLLPV